MSRADLLLAAAIVIAALVVAAGMQLGPRNLGEQVAAMRTDLADLNGKVETLTTAALHDLGDLSDLADLPVQVAALRREVTALGEQVAAQGPAAPAAEALTAVAALPAEVAALRREVTAVRGWLLDAAFTAEACKRMGEYAKKMEEERERALGNSAEFWGIQNNIQANLIQAQLACRGSNGEAYAKGRGWDD